MSTIKSSDEHLTLNADGTSKEVKIQRNGTQVLATTSTGIDVTGTVTAVGSMNIDHSGSDTFATLVGPLNRDLRIDLQANDDNDGLVVRDLRDNSERFVVNAGGIVTKPTQPAFRVVKTSDQTLDSTANVTITWQTEEFDVGSNFASNTFTAPVTGKYFLQAQARTDTIQNDANYYLIKIETSNNDAMEIFKPLYTSDSSYQSLSASGVFHLDANDTAYVHIRQNGGSANSHVDDGHGYTHFSGYLLG